MSVARALTLKTTQCPTPNIVFSKKCPTTRGPGPHPRLVRSLLRARRLRPRRRISRVRAGGGAVQSCGGVKRGGGFSAVVTLVYLYFLHDHSCIYLQILRTGSFRFAARGDVFTIAVVKTHFFISYPRGAFFSRPSPPFLFGVRIDGVNASVRRAATQRLARRPVRSSSGARAAAGARQRSSPGTSHYWTPDRDFCCGERWKLSNGGAVETTTTSNDIFLEYFQHLEGGTASTPSDVAHFRVVWGSRRNPPAVTSPGRSLLLRFGDENGDLILFSLSRGGCCPSNRFSQSPGALP